MSTNTKTISNEPPYRSIFTLNFFLEWKIEWAWRCSNHFNGRVVVCLQYREPGVLLWRGFTLQEFANQCFGNKADYGKGRQMPVHYGSNKLNYFTVSATIAYSLLSQLIL